MVDNEGKFQFYWNLEKREKLVAKYGTNDKKELMQKITEDILSDTQPNITPDYETQLKLAKLQYWQEKARKEKALATIAEEKAIYVTTFGTEPSPQANQALKQHAENKIRKQNTSILRDDGTLKCISCGIIIPMKAYDFQQADEYQHHVKAVHQRELYIESEKPIIAKLLGMDPQ